MQANAIYEGTPVLFTLTAVLHLAQRRGYRLGRSAEAAFMLSDANFEGVLPTVCEHTKDVATLSTGAKNSFGPGTIFSASNQGTDLGSKCNCPEEPAMSQGGPGKSELRITE